MDRSWGLQFNSSCEAYPPAGTVTTIFPEQAPPVPQPSRPAPSAPDASPLRNPRNRPARRTTDARRWLSDPFVGAANLNPRHKRGSAGRSLSIPVVDIQPPSKVTQPIPRTYGYYTSV